MAEKKEVKTVLERTYNVPLRKAYLKAPKYRRAKKAVNALREFLARHMKSDMIVIGKHLNQKLWVRGIKNPPHHVNVTAVKDSEGVVKAELVGAPKEKVRERKKGARKEKESEKAADTEKAVEMAAGEEKIKASPESSESPKRAKVQKKAREEQA